MNNLAHFQTLGRYKTHGATSTKKPIKSQKTAWLELSMEAMRKKYFDEA
jgi:hypothetical protein